ncbi:protein PLANT CADMIUM RESISTANCE 12 [Ricinus communis]|uniref:protein PLANT CADMIUM RESISTANCE 12 n=1 Tax=Ricinus communis TaxID=3988 RepID=UPI000D698E19|nr:protein PLANT CADMIUM RESISTANCE 12 [Ricinus communis]|eukprot:XP_025014892.1 protein PLANT CADMIUM RESISTANCE 12 [Ricinus communis]
MNSSKFPADGQWTSGLCDCLDDPSVCFFTCFCPCITFGRIAEIVDRGNTSCQHACLISYAMGFCAWLYARTYRSKLRGHFSLPEAPCSDSLVHCFCCVCACALCQEYRELKNRGADPSIGWQANVDKWNREGLNPPFVTPGMDR